MSLQETPPPDSSLPSIGPAQPVDPPELAALQQQPQPPAQSQPPVEPPLLDQRVSPPPGRMQLLKARVSPWLMPILAFLQRHPRALALFSFGSGVASFFLVNRQAKYAGVIAIVLLVSWLVLMVENLLTKSLARRFGVDIPPVLLRYGTQMIHQESLFFVLPFFFVTTTWNSGQTAFMVVLTGAALISIIDPVYYKWLAARRLAYMAFHTLALFAVMLTALPVILHLTTDETYLYATVATVVLAIPTLIRRVPEGGRWPALLKFAATIAVLAVALWFGRYWVPPATLWLTDVHVAFEVDNRNRAPGKGLKTLTEAQLRQNGLYAYTAIRAPRGLGEQVFHVWTHEGKEVDRIALKIRGGREQGYRTWTHKTNFPAQVLGDWQVRVMTEAGQLIGVVRFDVVTAGALRPEPVKADPVKQEPVKPEPVQPEPVLPEPDPVPAPEQPAPEQPAPDPVPPEPDPAPAPEQPAPDPVQPEPAQPEPVLPEPEPVNVPDPGSNPP